MLIFVQVCKTIDKIFSVLIKAHVLKEQMREMESTRRKLEVAKKKRFWRQAVLKLTSSEALSSEAGHQKLTSSEASEDHQELKDWRTSKCCSNEDWITSIIAEDWKSKATTNSNGFEVIGCLFVGESWKKTIVWSVQPLSPLLCFVFATGQEQQLCLHQCSSRLGMDLKLIIHRTITKSGIRSLVIWSSFKRLFSIWCASNFQRIFHISI